ncbi:MAG: ATPase, T2SS/T4P/T4SS family, partial [archaeon]
MKTESILSPLGWGLLPPRQNHYPIHPALPILSLAEEALAHEVLETFYTQTSPHQTIEGLRALLREYCQLHHFRLENEQESYLSEICKMHAFEAGPLTPLLHDKGIEEIVLTGISPAHPVRVYQTPTGWKETPLYFTDPAALISLFNRLTLDTGKRLSANTPVLNAILPTGARIHAAISPICSTDIEASIRLFTHRPTHPTELLRLNTLTPESFAYITLALQLDCNLLIVGNTGSGKTTTLNA